MTTRHVSYRDPAGRKCSFCPDDVPDQWLATDDEEHLVVLYHLGRGHWVLCTYPSPHSDFCVPETLGGDQAREWLTRHSCTFSRKVERGAPIRVIPEGKGEWHYFDPTGAEKFELEPDVEQCDIFGDAQLVAHPTLYRRADGVWVLVQEHEHLEAGLYGDRTVKVVTAQETIDMLLASGYPLDELPDDLRHLAKRREFPASGSIPSNATPPTEESTTTNAAADDLRRIATAVTLIAHTDLSAEKIARQVGRERSWLYRNETTKRALSLRRGNKADLPRGSKDKDGNLDAWDEDDREST
jgi:hypothetical protein